VIISNKDSQQGRLHVRRVQVVVSTR